MKMGSGNNSTPVISGLLRRRYSVPEIIMRKHSLAQQKAYEEGTAATAPSPYRSPATVYQKSYSTSTPNRTYPLSSGSDSNLSLRRVERGEMSMRKSTLLRRIWNREMKRYDDARSGSWSPPMRRSQRRLHPEPVELHRCEECRKFEDDNSDESEELAVTASHKRLRLISSNGKESSIDSPVSQHNSSSNITRHSTSDRVQITTNCSLESPTSSITETSSSKQKASNVHIYMTPMKSDQSSSEPIDQSQDMLRVEIDLDSSENNGNDVQVPQVHITSDINQNQPATDNASASPTKSHKSSNGDSPLDRFISKLLIDNLTDLAEEINEQFENNNNLMRNSSTPKSKKSTSMYPDHMRIVVDKCDNFDLLSSDSNNLNQSGESSNLERIIYFPSFSLECKDDMSSYASNYSDLELNSIPGESLVKMNVGSTYAQNEQTSALVVPRMLNMLPRTESLEAQHSLNSAVDDGAEHGKDDDTDDSVSLVDSLDELQSASNNNDEVLPEKTEETNEELKAESKDEENEENSSSVCREPEAFFVSMAGSESCETATVAETMPEKLKERIKRRQRELDKRWDEEHKRKQKEEEELMDSKVEAPNSVKSPVRVNKGSPTKDKTTKKSENTSKKSKTKVSHLRSEIGLLESYTIDSKGNMQMRAPNKKTDARSADASDSIPRKTNPGKSTIQRKQSVIASKPPEIVPPYLEKMSTSSTTKSRSHPRTDIQKMTIFQAQSDIITPDSENGPRRVYQKTEIQDGEKHIEILEIVECIETSPECSPNRQHTYRVSSKSSLSRRSKIPIPTYKVGRSNGYQKALRCPLLRESSPNSVKCLARNLQSNSSNKVDRVIAELLIDALNRPEEVGIEIIKSPKDFSRDRSSSKKQSSQKRNTPRRSANSTKYQQVFEVIPEEKSSFSVDSSNDETTKSSSKTKTECSSSNASKSRSDSTSISTAPTKEINELSVNSTSSMSSSQKQSSGSSGRLAVNHAEPNAWIGFFRRHNDSSMDEDESTSQLQPQSSTETSAQPTITSASSNTAAAGTTTPQEVSSAEHIKSADSDNILNLIDKTFESNTEPKPSILTKPSSTDKVAETPATITTGATNATTSETFMSTCKSCKIAKKRNSEIKRSSLEKTVSTEKQKVSSVQQNVIKKSDTVLKIELKQSAENFSQSSVASSSTTTEPNSDSKKIQKRERRAATTTVSQADVWRVQSPDICKMAIPKLKDKQKYDDNLVTSEASTEIDTQSFVVVEENYNRSPSQLNRSSNIPIIPSTTSAESINPIPTNKCTICCYCNPDLHKSIKTASSTPCPYCNRRRTPPRREEETNTESDYFLNHPFYQSMTKSDHTHIRTRSRDSDVVSTKCTKVNEKIKNYNIPEGPTSSSHESTTHRSKATKNLSRPKNVINLPPTKTDTKTMHKTLQDTIKSKDSKPMKNSSPDKRSFRLPSPYTNLSSTSFERTTSPSSSSDSTCPTTPNRCPPVLPPPPPSSAARRQNFSSSRNNSKEKDNKKEKNVGGKVVGSSGSGGGNYNNNNNGIVPDNTNNNVGGSNGKLNGQANGWSVTVAGSYNQDMAPDLEMRLSFPKPGGSGGNLLHQNPLSTSHAINQIIPDRRNIHHQRIINGNSIYSESHYQDEDLVNDNYTRHNNQLHHQALPPSGNPKRTLTRIVSERTHSQRDINFPEVNSTLRNSNTTREMAKKAIKHTECSVAVASATRTISKFTRGRRTVSYHTLNTAESSTQRTNNRDRHLLRDNSLDLGNLSSGRRMSLESQIPSVTDCLTLSIMGNAIAPEQKPRVLTMSEKDLTRRHQSCFTRNRAFFT